MAANELFRTLDTRYGQLTIFANDSGAVSQSLVKYGEWAENELSFLYAMIGEGATVLDIGAYIGTHTLAFARFVGPLGQVVAVEPQIRSFELLKRNIEANALGNVRAENAVASFETDEAIIPSIDIEQSESFGSASLLGALHSIKGGLAAEPQPYGANDLAVRLMTVDSLGITNCALIKIDVEGMEDAVLRGAEETIRRSTPIIYAECNSLEHGLRSLKVLKVFGYRVLAHVVSAYNPDNFLKDQHNLFGAAREVALVAVAGSNLERIERYQVRPCEMLLDIETADDLALALLNKPQYKAEVLRVSAAAESGGALYLDEVDALRVGAEALGNDVEALRRRVGAGRRNADAIESAQEIEGLHERLDQTHGALAEAQCLAIERAKENEGLHERLDQTHGALAEAQRLAIERAKENEGLHERLDRTHGALAEAQRLAIERAQEIEGLHERLDRTHGALADTQRLAVERAQEIEGLHERLDRTHGALAEAQRLAIERAQEIEGLHERLDRTHGALADTQRLAVERAQEIEGLYARLDRTHAALAEAQRLAIERAQEIEALQEEVDSSVVQAGLMRRECDRQQARAIAAEAALASVYASHSWRFMAPIRAIPRLLGRARGR